MPNTDTKTLQPYERLEHGGCAGRFHVTTYFDVNAGGDAFDAVGIQVTCDACEPSFGRVAWSKNELWQAIAEHARRHLPPLGDPGAGSDSVRSDSDQEI